MEFGTAVARCFSRYAVFRGRAPRSEFWWFFLFLLLLTLATGAIAWWLDATAALDTVDLVLALATMLPEYAVAARRLHDRDRSGWWALLLAPLSATTFFPPEHGDPWAVIQLPAIMAGLMLLIMMIPPGTDGPNRFGPDPLRQEV